VSETDHKQMLLDANEILGKATPEQAKWVMKRLGFNTDRAAAKAVGIHPTTVSRWDNKAELDRAVHLLLAEPREAALSILKDAVIEAATVKVDGLQKMGKQAQATEILDRVLGRPMQRQEVTGADGGPMEHHMLDIERLLDRIYGNEDDNG